METSEEINTYDNIFWSYMSMLCKLSRSNLNNEIEFDEEFDYEYNNNGELDHSILAHKPIDNHNNLDNKSKIKKIRRAGKKQKKYCTKKRKKESG